METFIENKNRKTALAVTVLFHALLIFIFISIVFSKPVRSFEMEGFTFGMMNDNSNSPTVNTLPKKSSELDISNGHEKVIFDQTETSTFVTASSTIKENVDTVLQKALMKLHSVNKSNAINIGKIDEGKNSAVNTPPTPPEIMDYPYDLNNRVLLKKPERITDSGENGIVVVDIVVNEFGKVINAVAGQRGSTTTSSLLYSKAQLAAYEAKFNPSSEGIKEQRGTYTFVFTLE